MSLQLNFSICSSGDCSSITFTETTGEYDAVSNVGGWNGGGNGDIADFHYSLIEFYNSDGDLVDSVSYTNEFFPTSNDEYTKTLSITLPDGVYTIVYTVQEDEGSGITHTKTIQQAFWCNIECCVKQMGLDIDVECDCSVDAIAEFNRAYALLKGLQYSAGCGNITRFESILAVLQKICNNSNCSNCN